MSSRLVEVIVPDTLIDEALALVGRHCRRYWREAAPGPLEKISCIVQKRYVERLMTELGDRFNAVEGFSALVMTLEAVAPPLPETVATRLPTDETPLRPPTPLEAFFIRDRLSTDELRDDIADSVNLSPQFLVTVVLSTLIAALGMRSGQVAVIIGAMVIAPLLGPSIGMALAATVGDWRLGRKAVTTVTIGAMTAFAFTVALSRVISIDPSMTELSNRTYVHLADVALALASGAAGVLAFSQGASLSLVGVMIAVALVPPLGAAGLYAGHGDADLSLRALFLFATNLVCINVAGIATFLLQGLPPKRWRITSGILVAWLVVLGVFIALVTGRLAFGVAAWPAG